jgi:hypothetical protein
MFWFKGCPRCSGDLFEDRDQYGPFVTCVQCGFSKDIMKKLEEPLHISPEPMPAPVVPKLEGGKRRRLSHGGRHFSRAVSRPGDAPYRAAA